MRKYIAALFLTLFMLNAVTTVSAFDGGQVCCADAPQEKLFLAPIESSVDLSETIDVEAFKAYLRSEFNKFNPKIDISAYRIPYDRAYLNAISNLIREELPECFHVDAKRYWYIPSDIYTAIEVEYLCTPSEYSKKLAIWEETTDKILNGIEGNDSLTDVQKALLIHDRVIVHCEYDYDDYLGGKIGKQSYNAYGVLINGKAVCSGYAKAYKYLLGKVGIESFICDSEALDHAWNIVFVDGNYYHVDLTWDDPVWDVSGRVMHNNFLVSSAELFKNHTAKDYDTTPTDTKYDNWFWRNSEAAFQLIDNQIYYIDSTSGTLNQYDGTVLWSVDDTWYASAYTYWNGNFSRLSSYKNDLYYSQADAIYKYDLAKKTASKVLEPEHNFGDYFNIYGFKCVDGTLICEYNSKPSFASDTKKKYQITFDIDSEKTYKIEGTVTSHTPDGVTTVQLLKDDEELKSVEVIGKSGTYTFDNVVPGTYTIRLSKPKHPSVEYTVTVDNGNVTQNLEIWLSGDVNGDGTFSYLDISKLYAAFRNKTTVIDVIDKDINGDGKFNYLDISKLYAIFRGKAKFAD